MPYTEDFSMIDLMQALASTKDSSPGDEGITYPLIKHVPKQSLQIILLLCNTIDQMQLPVT